MRRLVLVGAALGVVGAAAALSWFLLVRDAAEPVSVDEVVEATTGTVGIYRTRGSEQVDALFGSRHAYPAETTITVTPDGDCVRYRWDALRDRSTTWEVCPAAGGSSSLRGYLETHRFFGTTERTDYRCRPGSTWRPAAEEPGTVFERTCASADTTESGSGRVVGADGDVLHLRVDLTLEGRTRGTGSLDLWLPSGAGLPVRVEIANDNRSESPIGDVHYVEEVDLELVSTETS